MSEKTEKRESEKTEIEKTLTDKQKLFCKFYLGKARFNATKAAILAGYSEKTARQIAAENLAKPYISEYIQTQLETLTLGANEVLARLTEIANADVDLFLDDAGLFSIEKARKGGNTPLIKKLKQKRTIRQKKTQISENMRSYLADDEIDDIETDIEIIYEETEFELYSAHEALRDLGKYHKLFTDKIEAKVENENPPQVVLYLPDNGRDGGANETETATDE
jgi:phage terminase small subunit